MRTWDSDDPNDPQSDIRMSVSIDVTQSYGTAMFKAHAAEGGRLSLNDLQEMVDRMVHEVRRKVEWQMDTAKRACLKRAKEKAALEDATA